MRFTCLNMLSDKWKEAQKSVASFLQKYDFGVKQELVLKNGRRIDILAQKKTTLGFMHVIIEVKDWNKVSRKQETLFCKQMIDYIIDYALETKRKSLSDDLWNRREKTNRELFLGILCLTKDAHFSFRKISQHFVLKNKKIKDIPYREQIAESMLLYVSRFDFLSKVFEDINYPLYEEPLLTDWMNQNE